VSMNPRAIKFVAVCWILVLTLVISLPVRAQVSGATLSGAITDASGGAVPNAHVAVKNIETGVTTETTTNATGAYTVPNLNPGNYQVSISASGFSTATSSVTLTVGSKQEMNLHLTVGQISQSVEVVGAAVQIDLATSTISGDVVGSEVRELPLNGRDWASLATLEPGVATVKSQNNLQTNGAGARGLGMQLTISGGRPTQNSYRLDGALMNDYSNAGPGSILGQNLGVDAIQEFSVLTSNYSAEYGFTSGGVINAITRSGTNQFHGSAFDFLRNDKFDADNFFDNYNGTPKSELRQNQFGASGGVPILKNKLFTFADYEGVRQVKGQSTSDQTISDAVRAGTVTNLADNSVINLTGGTITASNGTVTHFTPTPIDPIIQKFLNYYPVMNGGLVTNSGVANPDVGIFNWQAITRATENFGTLRQDWKISSKDTIFGTFVYDHSELSFPQHLDDTLEGFTSGRKAIIIEETHVFSPSLVNTSRVALSRTLNNSGQTPGFTNATLTALDPTLGMTSGRGAPTISLSGTGIQNFSGGNHGAAEQDYTGQIFQVYDDAFFTRGNHSLKFGGDFLRMQVNAYSPLPGDGSGGFSANGKGSTPFCVQGTGTCPPTSPATALMITGTAGTLLDFLTNQPSSAGRSVDITHLFKRYMRDNVVGVYFQDDWRIRPSLTLNLGIRYEMSTVPTEKYNNIQNLATLTASPTVLASLALKPPVSLDPAIINTALPRNVTEKNFEPRIGFAWDPFHDGKTAVRGGFGIFDALPLPYELILGIVSTAPLRPNFGGVGVNAGIRIPQGTWPFSVPTLASSSPAINRTWNYVDGNEKRNYVYQYNFNIQRTITPSTVLTVGYTGSRGIHNPMQEDAADPIIGQFNPGVGYYWPNTAQIVGGKPIIFADQNSTVNPGVGGMQATFWQSRSFYNALQVKVDKKMSLGFQIQGSFTWSKSLDDSSGSFAGDNFSQDFGSSPFYDLRLNKGPSDFDTRRNLVLNGLWNVPSPKSWTGFEGRVVDGWQLGSIVSLSDGIPFFPDITGDLLGEFNVTVDPPFLVPGCGPLVNPRNVANYINANCFELPQQTPTNMAINPATGVTYCDTTAAAALVKAAGKAAIPNLPTSCPNIRGDMARNSINFPGLVNFDFSVFKNNYIRRISETFNAQFRAEFFNVFNHANFGPIAIGGPGAGQLSVINTSGTVPAGFGALKTTQTPGREIQFALKLVW
jgi:hypothetical protein